MVPGLYTFVYEVSIEGLPDTKEEFIVTIVLKDPCDPPVKLTPIALEDQSYTVTDVKKPYIHEAVVADPAYCPIRYEYTIEQLENGNEPIT